MKPHQHQLQSLYEAFNARDIEAVLAAMQPDVQWANGLERGFVYGRDAVREYWIRQFETMQPHLTILGFQTDAGGREVVTVHQIVRDLQGALLLEQKVQHRFSLQNGLVELFEIVDLESL